MRAKKMLYIDTNLINATYMVKMIREGHWMPEFRHFYFRVENWDDRRNPFLVGYYENKTVVIEPSDWSWKVFRASSKTNLRRNWY